MGNGTGRSGHPIYAAVYARRARSLDTGPLGPTRRRLVGSARGVVVDLGAGVGRNLAHLRSAVTEVHLVEPDPHMVRRLPRDLSDHVHVHQAGAEELPLDDASVDTVLSTVTLCTVDDVGDCVSEIRRVLRPGGQLLVLEHVRSLDASVARWQDRLHRPWRWLGGGCNSNRDTLGALAEGGFDTSPLRRLTLPGPPPTREWVTGRLTA